MDEAVALMDGEVDDLGEDSFVLPIILEEERGECGVLSRV